MSVDELTGKQVLKAELEPLMAEDQEMRASKAELYNWQLLTRSLDVERAFEEAMQRVDGQSRMVPVWVRDIGRT